MSDRQELDLGPVDAYGLAVTKGYTGTREDFAKYMADVANGAEVAKDKAADAIEAAEAAEIAKAYAKVFTGAPRMAATPADMTDHDLIYVFTGSASNYTTGNWYYWKESTSAWTSGGVYNSSTITTDTSLSVSGAAADAEKVGLVKKTVDYTKESAENGIEQITGSRALTFKEGRYTCSSSTPAAGQTVSYDNSASEACACAISACTAGDRFYVDVYGYTGNNRAYFFCNGDMQIVSGGSGVAYAGAGAHIEGYLTAPANSAFVVFTNRLSSKASGYFAYKGTAIKDTASGTMKANRLSTENSFEQLTGDRALVFQPGIYATGNSGSVTDISKPAEYDGFVCAISSCLPGDNFIVNVRGGGVGRRGYCWLDEDCKQLSEGGSAVFVTGTITAPENAKYLVLNNAISQTTNPTNYYAYKVGAHNLIDDITEKVSDVVSYAEITGDPDDTYTQTGITFTKKADNEFTLTGNSSKTAGKGFNVLLGNEQVTGTSSQTMTANLTTPGVYTVSYKTSGPSGYDRNLFAITDSTFSKRKYLKNGETFTVEDDICLFVYGASNLRLGTKTLTVKWALYKGEEYIGFPYVENGQRIAVDPVARNSALRKNEEEENNEMLSWGKYNVAANAKQIMELKWTPKAATMPRGTNTYFETDTEYKGVPYSSVRDNDKAVGTNVSIQTFMTALNDPNSVLYTRRSTTTNANAYYGTVCSGLCNHAYGLGLNLTNYYLGESDMFDTVPMQDIQIGDMLYTSGHVAMIYDVNKDKWGRVQNVTVMEEWAPVARFKYYSSYSSFMSGRSGYIARRYKYMSGVEYVQSPYVRCFDEDESEIVYPDVQTDHGDAAVFGYCSGAGETFTDYANVSGVTINVINSRDFESIVVTREGASSAVYSTSTIESFTIPATSIVPGLYTVTATGTEYTSVSTFFVADVNGTWDKTTGVITFSSSNATPVLVDVYSKEIEDGKYKILCNPYVLTDADKTAGSANVLSLMDSTHQEAKVTFNTPYGQAIWRSEAHATWAAIE